MFLTTISVKIIGLCNCIDLKQLIKSKSSLIKFLSVFLITIIYSDCAL